MCVGEREGGVREMKEKDTYQTDTEGDKKRYREAKTIKCKE